MKIGDRRMCDRCGEEIERGEHWYLFVHNGTQVCPHCVQHLHSTGELCRTCIYTTFADTDDGGVSVFISED